METVIIPKKKYEDLERQATLYQKLLKRVQEEFFPIEKYTPRRLRQFLKEDRVSSKIAKATRKLLASK